MDISLENIKLDNSKKIQDTLKIIKEYLELYTPVRTGRMLAGWTFVIDGVEYENLDIPPLKKLKNVKQIHIYNKQVYASHVIENNEELKLTILGLNNILEKS